LILAHQWRQRNHLNLDHPLLRGFQGLARIQIKILQYQRNYW